MKKDLNGLVISPEALHEEFGAFLQRLESRAEPAPEGEYYDTNGGGDIPLLRVGPQGVCIKFGDGPWEPFTGTLDLEEPKPRIKPGDWVRSKHEPRLISQFREDGEFHFQDGSHDVHDHEGFKPWTPRVGEWVRVVKPIGGVPEAEGEVGQVSRVEGPYAYVRLSGVLNESGSEIPESGWYCSIWKLWVRGIGNEVVAQYREDKRFHFLDGTCGILEFRKFEPWAPRVGEWVKTPSTAIRRVVGVEGDDYLLEPTGAFRLSLSMLTPCKQPHPEGAWVQKDGVVGQVKDGEVDGVPLYERWEAWAPKLGDWVKTPEGHIGQILMRDPDMNEYEVSGRGRYFKASELIPAARPIQVGDRALDPDGDECEVVAIRGDRACVWWSGDFYGYGLEYLTLIE